MKLSKKRVIILVSSVILLVLIGALFVAYEGGPYDKNNGKDIVVDIPMGSTVSSVADILKENNLIKNEVLFKLNFKMKNIFALTWDYNICSFMLMLYLDKYQQINFSSLINYTIIYN